MNSVLIIYTLFIPSEGRVTRPGYLIPTARRRTMKGCDPSQPKRHDRRHVHELVPHSAAAPNASSDLPWPYRAVRRDRPAHQPSNSGTPTMPPVCREGSLRPMGSNPGCEGFKRNNMRHNVSHRPTHERRTKHHASHQH